MEKDKYFTLWLTGLSGAGKSTIANELERRLKSKGLRVKALDGDDFRDGLNKDLDFSPEGRKENLRRAAHVAKLFNESEMYVISSFISPREEYRALVKGILPDMKLVYVNASVEECTRRDVKGLYKRALAGEIENFTGISAPFESPLNPDFTVYTASETIEESVDKIVNRFYKGIF